MRRGIALVASRIPRNFSHTGPMARPRLTIPNFRDPPADVLANLRAIDDTIELVYMGEHAWAIGSVERNAVREEAGRRKIATALRIVPQTPMEYARYQVMLWEGRLLLQGFALINTFRGEPDSRIEEWLRERTYNWASDLDRRWRELLADEMRGDQESDVDFMARHSPLVDEVRLRDAYRHAFRKPVTLTSRYNVPTTGVVA